MRARDKFRTGTKIRQVHDEIRELAFARGPNSKLPTARELCAQFQINTDSLNETLRELESQNVIFRKQGSGIYVSPRIYQKSIAILVDTSLIEVENASPFWGILWAQLNNAAQMRVETHNEDFHSYITSSYRNVASPLPARVLRDVESGALDVVIGIGLSMAATTILDNLGIQVIAYAGNGTWHVAQDSLQIYSSGIQALVAAGCKRIGVWMPLDDIDDDVRLSRMKSMITDVVSKQAVFSDELYWHWRRLRPNGDLPSHQAQGYFIAREVFGGGLQPLPDGLLLMDDMLAHGVLRAFAEMGIQAGKDIHIAATSNKGSPILFGDDAHLIQMQTDPLDIVRGVFDLLDSFLTGREVENPVLRVESRLILPSL
jgi:DNA-binding LacI/PurR family transcriptional regulator